MRLARHCIQDNASDQAEDLLREALDLDPDHVDARWILATLLLDRGDVEGAATHLVYLRSRSPEDRVIQALQLRADESRSNTTKIPTDWS